MKLNKISQVLAVAACLAAGSAQAGPVTQTVTYDLTNIASTKTNLVDVLMQFQQFNSALGTLTGVELDVFSGLTTTVSLVNNNLGQKSPDVSVSTSLSLKDPLSASWGATGVLIPGTLTVAGKGTATGTPGTASKTGTETLSASHTYSGSQLAAFIGTGNMSSLLSVNAQAMYSANKVAATYDTKASGYGHVTYTFISAVPEPETYGMLLLGLGLVGFVAKRNKRAA